MKAFVLLAFALLLTGEVSASDQFSWLRDDSRSGSNVLKYLEQQNNKTHQYQERIQSLSESLQKIGMTTVLIELTNHGRKLVGMNMRS